MEDISVSSCDEILATVKYRTLNKFLETLLSIYCIECFAFHWPVSFPVERKFYVKSKNLVRLIEIAVAFRERKVEPCSSKEQQYSCGGYVRRWCSCKPRRRGVSKGEGRRSVGSHAWRQLTIETPTFMNKAALGGEVRSQTMNLDPVQGLSPPSRRHVVGQGGSATPCSTGEPTSYG